jgi:hypothetical protein
VSPYKCPAYLAPALCMFCFCLLSFLHLPSPPVRFLGSPCAGHEKESINRIHRKLKKLNPAPNFFYCFIIHMCKQHLGHFSPLPPPSPLPPTPPTPSHPHPLNTWQKLFCPYF